VVGEFGGNDYNAPLFAGKGLEMVYKFMPDVIQGISEGVEVAHLLICSCVLLIAVTPWETVVTTTIDCVRCRL
jgi:hypothetical protein